MIVDFVTIHARWPWARQLGPGIAPGVEFRFGHRAGADWLVVYDDIRTPVTTDVPKAQRILFVTEPPGIKTYPAAFLRQFGTIVSPVPLDVPGSRILDQHPALPWFMGVRFEADGQRKTVLDLEALRQLKPAGRRKSAISTVISTKSQLPRHRERLALVEMMSARLGERFAVYGHGFQAVADKAEAILPFRYHLVLENNDIPHFWTEKLADAYLGWALPLYAGCRNVGLDFPSQSLIEIELADPARVVETIEAMLAEDPWESRLGAIAEARTRLLEEHNLFAVIARIAAAGEPDLRAKPLRETLLPSRESSFAGRLKGITKRLVRR